MYWKVVLGIILDQGLIESVEIPVYQYITEFFDGKELKRSITIRHTLSLETGLYFENNNHTRELIPGTGNSLEFLLDQDLIDTHGSDWYTVMVIHS